MTADRNDDPDEVRCALAARHGRAGSVTPIGCICAASVEAFDA